MEIIQDSRLCPMLKWSGGKSGVYKLINKKLPQALINGEINNYYEPFFGGGAMFLKLIQNVKINRYILSDINEDLILFYKVVKNNPKELISLTERDIDSYIKMADIKNRKIFYNKIRTLYNIEHSSVDYDNYSNCYISRAAQLLFLNKTCWGGRYRQSLKGNFNVPCSGEDPAKLQKDNIFRISTIFNRGNVDLRQADYKEVCKEISGNDSFVYFDPPYEGTTSDYYKKRFTHKDHIELSQIYRELNDKAAFLMMNNSCQTKEYYDGFKIKHLTSMNTVSTNPLKRKEVEVLLITNY